MKSMSSVNSSLNQEIIFFLKRGTMGTAQDERYLHTRVAACAAHDSPCACLGLRQCSRMCIRQKTNIKYYNTQGINLIKSGYRSAD